MMARIGSMLGLLFVCMLAMPAAVEQTTPALVFDATRWDGAGPAQRVAMAAAIVDDLLAGRAGFIEGDAWSEAFDAFTHAWSDGAALPLVPGTGGRLDALARHADSDERFANGWDALWTCLSRDYLGGTPEDLPSATREALVIGHFTASDRPRIHPEQLLTVAEQLSPGHEAQVRALWWPVSSTRAWVHLEPKRTLMLAIWSAPGYGPNEDELLAMLDQQGRDQDLYSVAMLRRNEAYEYKDAIYLRQLTTLQADPSRMYAAAQLAGQMLNALVEAPLDEVAKQFVAWLEASEAGHPQEYHQDLVLAAGLHAWMTHFTMSTPPAKPAVLTAYRERLKALLQRCKAWDDQHPPGAHQVGLPSIAELTQRLDALTVK